MFGHFPYLGAHAMESLRGLTAIFLCCSLCLLSSPVPKCEGPGAPAQQAAEPNQPQAKSKSKQKHVPNSAPDSVPGQLRGDERILQALNRFTFGPKPGDLEAVRKMGLDEWFDQQLRPAAIDETDLDARLAQFPAMQWSMQDLFFRLPSNPIIRQAAQGRVDVPETGTLHAVYEDQIYRIQARQAAQADKQTVAANQAPGLANGAEPEHERRRRHGRKRRHDAESASNEPGSKGASHPIGHKSPAVDLAGPGDECHDAHGARRKSGACACR